MVRKVSTVYIQIFAIFTNKPRTLKNLVPRKFECVLIMYSPTFLNYEINFRENFNLSAFDGILQNCSCTKIVHIWLYLTGQKWGVRLHRHSICVYNAYNRIIKKGGWALTRRWAFTGENTVLTERSRPQVKDVPEPLVGGFSLRDALEEGFFSDLSLRSADGQTFPCHRIVLASCSPGVSYREWEIFLSSLRSALLRAALRYTDVSLRQLK